MDSPKSLFSLFNLKLLSALTDFHPWKFGFRFSLPKDAIRLALTHPSVLI